MNKTIQKAFLLSLITTGLLHAQYLTFNKESNGTNAIIVPTGERWKIISYMVPTGAYIDIYTSTNSARKIGRITSSDGIIYGGEGMGGSASGITIIGPATIQVGFVQDYYFAIEKKTSVESGNVQSTAAVVIPTSATGDVDVKLEQSADNVTWTECLPGTYNSSTVKRFFRLRAVEK